MKVKSLMDYPVDLSTIKECNSFTEWVDNDISKAFYLGFMRHEFADQIEELTNREDGSGIELLKSIDGASIEAKPYLKELARLMEPYLQSSEGFVVLDMVNDVLERVSPKKEDDIYKIAYILGIYTDYLYNCKAKA